MEVPANPWMRPRLKHTVKLGDGAEVILRKIPARRGHRIKARMATTWGPLFVLLIDDVRDSKGTKVPAAEVLRRPAFLTSFLKQTFKHIAEQDPEELMRVFADMISGCATFKWDGHELELEGTADELGTLFDEALADSWEMYALFVEAFMFNLGPTTLAKGTFAALASGKNGRSSTPTSDQPPTSDPSSPAGE